MTMRNLVKAKLTSEAPHLAKQLEAKGQLKAYLDETASEATSNMVSLAMQIAKKQGYDKKESLLDRAGIMSSARQAATEIVLSEMEFPQDDSCLDNQEEVTGLADTSSMNKRELIERLEAIDKEYLPLFEKKGKSAAEFKRMEALEVEDEKIKAEIRSLDRKARLADPEYRKHLASLPPIKAPEPSSLDGLE